MKKQCFILIMFLLLITSFSNEVKANDTILNEEFERVLIDFDKVLNTDEWAKKLMNIDEAHKLGIRGQGVKIAVMDSGIVDSPHYTVVDGIDCVNRNIFNICKKRDVNDYPDDILQHGTNIAHIIANANFGIVPDANLYDIRVVNHIDTNGDCL